MKRILLFLFAAICTANTLRAYDFKSGDLCYNITSNVKPYEVEVTANYRDQDGNPAYWGIKMVVIPTSIEHNGKTYSVTSIGDKAFYNCTGLTSVTIGNGVTSIGSSAFFGCTGLISVTIPESVTSIGSSAFSGCTGLTSVTIPESVTSIGSSAFSGCTGLTSVTIPESVTSIGRDAFFGCSGLTSVTIPESVTSIGNSAFFGCTGLTSVSIPNSVTSIESFAFDRVPNIVYHGSASGSPWGARNVNRYVDGYLVYKDSTKTRLLGCSSIVTKISIPESVTSIEYPAFSGCTGLTSITIPESVTNISPRAFDNTPWYENQPDGIMYINRILYGYKGEMPANTSILVKDGITSIGEEAFSGCTGLTSVTIPEGVTSIGEEAFSGCTGLTSITIPNSVTSIGEEAFSGCKGLTSITIPNSVKSIGESAFEGCTGLTSVTIPESVTSIGSYAFFSVPNIVYHGSASGSPWGARSVNGYVDGYLVYSDATKTQLLDCSSKATGKITIPNSVTSIGEKAFSGCTGITSVTIPNSVTSIGEEAFWVCTGLTSVTIGNGVTSIGEKTFKDCTGLTSITIPNSVKSIGDYAFSGCSGLTTITIPESVTSIGEEAFRDCTGLTSITIPNSVTCIERAAFYLCTGLTSVTIPESVWSIGWYAFYDCTGLTSITIPKSVTSIGAVAFRDVLNVVYHGPASGSPWGARNVNGYVDGYLVYKDSTKTRLLGCGSTATGKITIPNSVTSIGEYAFSRCTGLTSITIPNGVTSIGDYAFSSVPNIVYNGSASGSPWGARSVNGYVDGYLVYSDAAKTRLLFCNSKATGQITIPNSVTSIGEKAFSGCTGITSVTIPNSVTSIGEKAFRGCTGLTSVTIGNGVTSIGENAFSGCTGLAKTNYTGDIAGWCNIYFAISNGGSPSSNPVFYSSNLYINDVEVKDLVIPNGVTSIGRVAFRGCTGLTSVTIPEGVTSIGEKAFRGCTGLTSVTIPNSVTSIGNDAFSGCTGLTSVTIGNGVTSIESGAFSGCTGLTSVTIGNGVTSIESGAFYGCTGLTSVVIGRQVRSIDNNVFPGCTSLHSVIVKALTPPTIKGYLFNDGHPYYPRILYTPCGHLSAYQEADEWKWFADIQEPPVFEVEVNVVSELEGSASVDSESTCDMEATISATPNDGYRFTYWSDGNTDNPRTIVLTQDTALTAYFEEIPTYAVSLSCDAKQGTVSGEGTYQEGKQVSVSATPKTGYRFTHWSDSNTDNPRTIVLMQDTALTAYFEEIPTYAVSLSCDAEQGTVSGSGTYREGEQVTISATPNEGYEFVQWSDSNTDNPRSWIVTEDVSLSAIFQPVTALPQTTAASQETQKVVKDGQVLILRNGKAYDMLGQEIR